MNTPITLDGKVFCKHTSKVVCVGRNYADHVKELNNTIPDAPILFMKPNTAIVDFANTLSIPQHLGSVHHELEIALLIGDPLTQASEQEVRSAIVGIGLGLDLTLRDLQRELKTKGQPWEKAKSFDGSCPLSSFVSLAKLGDSIDKVSIEFELHKNKKLQQKGNSNDMLFPIVPLISEITQSFTLNKGDIILTGTPKGVGELNKGDLLNASLLIDGQSIIQCDCTIE